MMVSRYAVYDHPHICNYLRWTEGRADYKSLYCGGEVRGVTMLHLKNNSSNGQK